MLQVQRMKIPPVSSTSLAAAFVALTIGMTTSMAGCGSSSADTTSNSLLPRTFVVLLNLVNQYFDPITQQESTGEDSTAQVNPLATRAVFFVESWS